MSTLYVTEYAEVHLGLGGRQGQVPVEPPLAQQTVAISGSSAASNPFNAATQVVRLHSDVICSVNFGNSSPTATTSNQRFAANQTEFKAVPRGGGYSVAVISNS